MTDDDLLAAFEAAEDIPLPHAAHVRLAWLYLRRAPLPLATARFTRALIRFAAARGVPHKYSAEITRAWMTRVGDRIAGDAAATWEAFAAANPDLLVYRAAL